MNKERKLRRATLIGAWGIGAMVNFPNNESLMTAGLDEWPNALEECPPEWLVSEERLQKRLGVSHFRYPPAFYKPNQGGSYPLQSVPFVRFPQWHFCPHCGNLRKLALFGSPQRCDGPHWPSVNSCNARSERSRPFLLPFTLVAICREHGHIEDVPLMELVHSRKERGPSCRLRLQTGRSAKPLGRYTVRCTCGEKVNLGRLSDDDALEKIKACGGQRPWLGEDPDGPSEDHPQSCGCSLKVIQRGATNVYFAHSASSIYLPLWGENASRPVIEVLDDPIVWGALTNALVDGKIDPTRVEMICQTKPHLNLDQDEITTAAQRKLDGVSTTDTPAHTRALGRHEIEEQYRYDEYSALRTGKTIQPELEMELVDSDRYKAPIHGYFRMISLVKKLRETRAFYGFSRYLPDDGRDLAAHKNDLHLNPKLNWLPAIITRGEGIFFELSPEALERWQECEDVCIRANEMLDAMNERFKQRGREPRILSPHFVLLHTLAHLMINQLAIDCGYGASSLRERIYCEGVFADKPMHGFLIYTASGDAEGTMGGLVRQGKPGRLENILHRALKKALWCSYDPVCAESKGQGPDNCNRAACHGCAVLPETSCEESNRLLDRAALTGIQGQSKLGFFRDYVLQNWGG